MALIKQEIKQALAEAAHKFYELGWTPGEDSGDISVRDPETGCIPGRAPGCPSSETGAS